MERGIKLGKNVILVASGTFGSKILTFLLIPLYTAHLTTAEYGIADLLTTTISLLAPIFTVTISEAVLRFALDSDTDKQQVFQIGVIVHLVGFVCLMILSPILTLFEIIKPYYWYFIFFYFSQTLYAFLSFFLRGIGKLTVYTISGICQTCVTIVSNIIALVFLDAGINGYLLSFIFSNITASTIVIVFGKIYSYVGTEKIDKLLIRQMLGYSIPMIPNSISWWISNSSDRYILTYFCGATITGIYSVAYKIPTILSVFFGIFMTAWRLSAVENFGSEVTKRFYSSVFNKMFDFLIIIAASIILFNKLLAKILYAKDFYNAREIVPVLVIAFLLHGLSEFFGSIYTSSKNTNMLLYSSLLGAVLNIGCNLLLIPIFGGMGAAIATLISYGVIVIFRGIHTRRIMKMKINIKKASITMIILVTMCVIQTIDFKYAFFISSGLFILIMLVGMGTFIEMVKGISGTLRRKI